MAAKNGAKFEADLKKIFELKNSKLHSKTKRPDVFDPGKHVIMEGKSTTEENRILLFTKQMRNYLELEDDLKKQKTLDGDRIHVPAHFGVGFRNRENPAILKDIYVLGGEELRCILNDGQLKERKTKWGLRAKALTRINDLEDKAQTMFSIRQGAGVIENVESIKSELSSSLREKNDRWAHVRLDRPYLDKLCPSQMPWDYKGVPIILHYAPPMPAFAWSLELSRTPRA